MERKNLILAGAVVWAAAATGWAQSTLPQDSARQQQKAQLVRGLYTDALTHQQGYRLLESLCSEVGPRPVCSSGDARAIAWAVRKLEELPFDSVYLQEVPDNPRWVRGVETASAVGYGKKGALNVTALGGSVGTPGGNKGAGIRAELVEVQNFQELDALAAAGK
ncbi:MAG: hypothetical protein NWQ75_00465, partial [Schleiferiaceae bacterium]|nr:hypothetical protein [Schleiferiaceae bacterium]